MHWLGAWFHVSTRSVTWVRMRLAVLTLGAALALGTWLAIAWLLAYSD